MKQLRTTSFLALLVSLFVFSSCEETEVTTVDISGVGTIQGIVEIDSDIVEAPNDLERASGATVRIIYNSGDLDINSDGDDRLIIITTTTDANGEFSVEVPTTNAGVNFTVEFDEFETDYTYNDGTADVTNPAIFSETTYFNVFVRTGEIKNRNHNYGASPFFIED